MKNEYLGVAEGIGRMTVHVFKINGERWEIYESDSQPVDDDLINKIKNGDQGKINLLKKLNLLTRSTV